MKRSKIIIMMVLIFIGLTTIYFSDILRGCLLISFVFWGIWIVESRETKRALDYCDPLLFRCGRTDYVGNRLSLLKESLILYAFFKYKMAYIEVGLCNVRGDFQMALDLSITYKDKFSEKDYYLFNREVSYARLKLGDSVSLSERRLDNRDDLLICLALVNDGQVGEAIEKLFALREAEAGNVIFREVNLLLSDLLLPSQPKESAYYKEIANLFYE